MVEDSRRLRARSQRKSGDGGPEEKKENNAEPSASVLPLSPAARKWQIRIIYFIGFMVCLALDIIYSLANGAITPWIL